MLPDMHEELREQLEATLRPINNQALFGKGRSGREG